jgi:hypothetical protein
MINHPLTLLECEGKARDWKMGKNQKNPETNHFFKKIGRLANKNWNKS